MSAGRPGVAPRPADCSVHLEDENLGACSFVLRYRHEVSIQLRNQARSFPKRSRRNRSKQLVVVRIGLLINIYTAVTSSIDTLAGSVVRRVVDTLCYGQRGDFVSGSRRGHRNLPAAASNKQPMGALIEAHGDACLGLGNSPAR